MTVLAVQSEWREKQKFRSLFDILIMHASHSVSYISGEKVTSDKTIQVFSRSTVYRWPTFIGCGYKTRDTLQVMLFASFYMPIQCKCIDWRLWGTRNTAWHSSALIHYYFSLNTPAWPSTNFHSTEQKCGSSSAASFYFCSDLFRDVEPRNSNLVAVERRQDANLM